MDHALTPSNKPRKRHVERIVLNVEALKRIESWVAELAGRRIEVSRAALVNELICRRSPELAPAEIAELEGVFFDEVKFAKWALNELKGARTRGEGVTLSDILARHPRASQAASEPIKKQRKKRTKIEIAVKENGDKKVPHSYTKNEENADFTVKNESKMV